MCIKYNSLQLVADVFNTDVFNTDGAVKSISGNLKSISNLMTKLYYSTGLLLQSFAEFRPDPVKIIFKKISTTRKY